jgi:hypothetical protein
VHLPYLSNNIYLAADNILWTGFIYEYFLTFAQMTYCLVFSFASIIRGFASLNAAVPTFQSTFSSLPLEPHTDISCTFTLKMATEAYAQPSST